MQIFSNISRTYLGPRDYSEPTFEYLERSGREASGFVRQAIENWFSNYPEDQQETLLSKIKSRDNSAFESACFELFLHETLLSLGFSIEVEPEIEGSKTKPDFLITNDQGSQTLVEAKIATDKSEKELSAEKHINIFLDTINKMLVRDFLLFVDIYGSAIRPIPGRKILGQVMGWLNELDVRVVESVPPEGNLPTFTINIDGLKIVFTAFPRPKKDRGKPTNRAICSIGGQGGWIAPHEAIRKKIKEKGSKYGKPEIPFLIALNTFQVASDKIDEVQALYGDEVIRHKVGEQNTEPTYARIPNGVWHGKMGVQYKRISGVLIFNSFSVWNAARAPATLYQNPYANYKISGPLCRFPQAIVKRGRIHWKNGKSCREILNLPEGWPVHTERK